MADTPKKRVDPNCFLCPNKRTYSLMGKNSHNYIDYISFLLNEPFEETCKKLNLGICKTCTNKLETSFDFVNKLKCFTIEQCDTNLSSVERFKRMSTSPLTPKLNEAAVKSHPNKRTKTRKSLQLSCTGETDEKTIVTMQSNTLITSMNNNTKQLCSPSYEQCVSLSTVPENTEHNYCVVEGIDHDYCASAGNTPELESGKFPFHHETVELLKKHQHIPAEDGNPVVREIVKIIMSNPVLLKAVEGQILQEVSDKCTSLLSRTVTFASVLSRHRNVSELIDHGRNLFDDILKEMSEQIPFVLDIFAAMVNSGKVTHIGKEKIAPMAAAYAILMNARNEKLSAWHRLTTIVAIQGHMDDSAITRLNHMGVMMSVSSKLRMLDEAAYITDTSIVRKLPNNPLIKVTGDNLDLYIRTGHKSLEKNNKDLHLFASNIIFSRIVKPGVFSTVPVQLPLESLTPSMFLPTGHFKETLVSSYCVILGRLLVELPAFSWMKSVLPAHINHPYQLEMSKKSDVFQLPIIMKNEAKHEDCVDILDTYETILGGVYEKAFVIVTCSIIVRRDRHVRLVTRYCLKGQRTFSTSTESL